MDSPLYSKIRQMDRWTVLYTVKLGKWTDGQSFIQ